MLKQKTFLQIQQKHTQKKNYFNTFHFIQINVTNDKYIKRNDKYIKRNDKYIKRNDKYINRNDKYINRNDKYINRNEPLPPPRNKQNL